jgi:hypothetical protein
MTLDTTKITHACEKMLTLTRRAAVSDDAHTRHEQIIAKFLAMATECEMVAERIDAPDWVRWNPKLIALHTEAAQAEERRCGTFAHAPSEMALLTTLRAAAMVLGFILSDADTADLTPEDEQARRYAEGHRQEARDAAE